MQPLGEAMLYADLRDADLARKLTVLTPVPGYCVCVDIVGSRAAEIRTPRRVGKEP